MRIARGLLPALLVLCNACVTVRLPRSGGVPRMAPAAAMQVPFVAQSVLLCGGAAIAMVERWWGRRGVFAEQFEYLVHRDEGGIRTTDLAHAVESRGWETRIVAGSPDVVQRSLADSAPVIALIQVGRKRYHYVVIVGWRDGRVIYHDPAVSPFTSLDTAAFVKRWSGARRWALLVRPAAANIAAQPTISRATPLPPPDSLPCRPTLDRAADAASSGDLVSAERHLAAAATQCPAEPLVLRELAGVRFRQHRPAEAVELATAYTTRVPADSLGWQLLASSRYLVGDFRGALAAWNRIGRPVVDLVTIDGVRRFRFRDVMAMSGMTPGSQLSASRLAFAQRRMADLPTFGATRVGYVAVPGGVVELRAVADEKPLIEPVRPLLLNTAIDAIFRRDVHLSLASPLRLGELWTLQWRWQPSDPRVAMRVAIPVRIGIPVVARIEQSWETYRFAGPIAPEQRDVSSFTLTGWVRPSVEALAGVHLEQLSQRGAFVALTAGTGYHDARDRLALLVEGDHAIPRGSGPAFQRWRALAMFQPPIDRWRTRWTMRVGLDVASAGTPIGLQPLAGGDLARAIPLRAHPFIIDGRLPSTRIARSITHGGIAGDHALLTRGPVTIGAGVFFDGAQVSSSAQRLDASRLYLDAGAGLRIGLAGTQWSALRIDVARGLTTDRRWGLTAGLAPAWPVRLGRAR